MPHVFALTRRALAVTTAVLVVASSAQASLSSLTVAKCLAGKLKSEGKGAAADGGCYAKNAASPDAAVLAACLARAGGKITAAFTKLDAKYGGACPAGMGDGNARRSHVAEFADQVATDAGGGPGACDAAKTKCVGKYVAARMSCYGKAANKGGAVDATCLAKAQAKLADGVKGCLDKAAAIGGCSHAGSQAAALQAGADTFVDAQSCLLDPSASGCPAPLCPATIEFTPAGGAASRLDLGWHFIGQNEPTGSGGTLTVSVTGQAGNECTFTGPVANAAANAGAIDDQRCTGDTSVRCSNAPGGGGGPCTGLGTCEFYWAPPWPLYLGGLSVCVVDRVSGSVTGTVDLVSGAVERAAALERRMYLGGAVDHPCPRCVGDPAAHDGIAAGTCDDGARVGLPCDADGALPAWPDSGATSLDCPSLPATLAGNQTNTQSGTTGTTSITLSAGSPACRATGFRDLKCACDMCNNTSLQTCSTHADCPPNGGDPGVCGGHFCLTGADVGLPCRTCSGGANDKGTCSVASECPGGSCVRPACAGGGACATYGAATQPNVCLDDTTTPGFDGCVDSAPVGDGRGQCAVGPVVKHCTPSSGHPQRECVSDSDCCNDAPLCGSDPVTPGDCGVVALVSCYLDNGVIGNSITAAGLADPLGGTIASPTIAGLSCAPPTQTPALNTIIGLPGPARAVTVEKMRFRP